MFSNDGGWFVGAFGFTTILLPEELIVTGGGGGGIRSSVNSPGCCGAAAQLASRHTADKAINLIGRTGVSLPYNEL